MNNCVFDKGKGCSALTEKECFGCRFRKTEKDLKQGRLKAKIRLLNLPTEALNHIFRKYYGRGINHDS